MRNKYNPEWWGKWSNDNYKKKVRLLRRAAGEKNSFLRLLGFFSR